MQPSEFDSAGRMMSECSHSLVTDNDMGQKYRCHLDLTLLRSNLSRIHERPVSEAAVAEWLAENGFVAEEDGAWIASDTDLGSLNEGELLDCQPLAAELSDAEDLADGAEGLARWVEKQRQAAWARMAVMRHVVPAPLLSQACVPASLIGRPRDVTLRWRKKARALVKAGSWDAVLADEQMVPIEDAPGDLVMEGPSPLFHGDHVVLYPAYEELLEASYEADYAKWYRTVRDLTLSGLNHFWFSLAAGSGEAGRAIRGWLKNLENSQSQ